MYIDKKKIIVIAGIVVLTAALSTGIIFLVRSCPEEEIAEVGTELTEERRQNILRLAGDYAAAGEYDRALNLLDGLLIVNPDDEDARALQSLILAMDRSGGTDALLEAQRRFLEEQARQNAALAASTMFQQQSSFSSSSGESEEAAARRAAAEAEEARRREQEEELARASREMQEAMRRVNNLVADGKAKLAAGDMSGADQLFNEARRIMPQGENRFESQKLAEMAEAYYDYRTNNPNASGASTAVSKAQEYATEAAAKDATQALPRYILGSIARDTNQINRAIEEFREASRLDTGNFLYFYNLGRVLFMARRFPEARDAFETCTRLSPNFEPAWYNLGGTFRALNRQDDALASYRRAVEIKADYVMAHREIGRILQARGDLRGAIDSFTKALQFSPNDFNIICELGATQSQAGNFTEAERLFTRALAINASDAQTNNNMAIVKLELKKYQEALTFARAAVDSVPNNAVYVYTLGLACEESGASDLAIQAYQRAASLDSKYVRPRINLSNMFISTGNLGEAITLLNEAYSAEPANFEVNNNLGAVYARQEKWANSILHYERALNSRPNDPTVRLNLARAYAGEGNLQSAQTSYQSLLRLAPDNWDAMFELGKTCVSLGLTDDAKSYLQDLIRRNPNYSNKAEAERIINSL